MQFTWDTDSISQYIKIPSNILVRIVTTTGTQDYRVLRVMDDCVICVPTEVSESSGALIALGSRQNIKWSDIESLHIY